MFLLNSRLASFVVNTHRMVHVRTSPKGYVQLSLPSSLRIVLPIAFVYSTRPPVSVYGTVKIILFHEHFLGNRKISCYLITAHINMSTDLPVNTCLLFNPPQLLTKMLAGRFFPLRSPLKASYVVLRLIEPCQNNLNTGILTCNPSANPLVAG